MEVDEGRTEGGDEVALLGAGVDAGDLVKTLVSRFDFSCQDAKACSTVVETYYKSVSISWTKYIYSRSRPLTERSAQQTVLHGIMA